MKSFNLTSKLIYTLITAVTFSLAAVAPATAQDADEPGRYRPQGREIARAIGNEFDEALYEPTIRRSMWTNLPPLQSSTHLP